MSPPSDPSQRLALAALAAGSSAVPAAQGVALRSAVEGEPAPDTTAGVEAGSNGSSLDWTLCRSAGELATTLERGWAVTGGVGPLPMLQAKATFLESLQTTIFSLSLVVRARRVTAALTLTQPRLRPEVAVPLSEADLETFVRLHGDGYVSMARVGGECLGVYTFFAQSRQQANEVARSFGAGLSIGGFGVSPQLMSRIQEASRSNGVNVSFRSHVVGLSSHPPLTQETLLEFASGFGALQLDDPKVLSLETNGYDQVLELADVFGGVAANRRLLLGDGIQEGVLRRRQRLLELRHQIDWVGGTYDTYGIVRPAELDQSLQQLAADLQTIREVELRYREHPTSPLTMPDLPSLMVGCPQVNVSVIDGEPLGGSDGEAFTYADRATAVRSRTRLAAVGLRTGSRVDQIRLTYEHEGDALSGAEPRQECYGGEGGAEAGVLQLGPGESIRRIEAETGTQVDRIFLSGAGQRIGGGGGAGIRRPDLVVPEDRVLLGFSGRIGGRRGRRELVAMTPVYAVFGPLRWHPVVVGEDP